MKVLFDICTTVYSEKGDELRQDISKFEVEITETIFHGDRDTPDCSEYNYDLPEGLNEQHEKLLIDAADRYIELYGYESEDNYND